MALRSDTNALSLFIGDTLFISEPQSKGICVGDGLLDVGVVLSTLPGDKALGLFMLARAQTVNSSEVSGKLREADESAEREQVVFGDDLLLRHVHSGNYLAIDPFNSAATSVKLAALSEMCRVKLMPAPSAQQTVDSPVTLDKPMLLIFSFKKLQFSLNVEEGGKKLATSLQVVPWQLIRACETEAYPRITPYSFVHLKHATLPVFVSADSEGLTGDSAASHLSTYWQLEPAGSVTNLCKLRNLFTQQYLTTEDGMNEFSVITSAYEIGAFWYQTSFQLSYMGAVLGVSQEHVNDSVAARLLNPSLSSAKVKVAFGSTRTYFQFHPVEAEEGQLINRICHIVNNLDKSASALQCDSNAMVPQFAAALNWAEANSPSLGVFLWESGFFGTVIQTLRRTISLHGEQLPPELGKLVTKSIKILLTAVSKHEASVDFVNLYLDEIMWLRHRLDTLPADPQFNLTVTTRLLLAADFKVKRYPMPQSGLAFQPTTDGRDVVAAWAGEIQTVTQANAAYQSLVLRMLNHMMFSCNQYDLGKAKKIAAAVDTSKLPSFQVQGEAVFVCFPAVSREAFLAENQKLKAVIATDVRADDSKAVVPLTKIWTKDELYWRYVDQSIRLLGFLHGTEATESCHRGITTLLAILKEGSHVKTMRSCLRVLSVVLFQNWRRVPLYEVFAVTPGNVDPAQSLSLPYAQQTIQLRRFLLELVVSESLSESLLSEHTNSLLLIEVLLRCCSRLMENFFIDSSTASAFMRLAGMLLSGFGVATGYEASWVAKEIAECLRAGFTAKRTRALQRLFRASVFFVKTLIHTKELFLIWRSLESNAKKEPFRLLANEIIREAFSIPLQGQPPATNDTHLSPLIPKTAAAAALKPGQPTLLQLAQKLIFKQHTLVGVFKGKMLSFCEKMAALPEPLTKILNSVARANEAEIQVMMDLVMVETQAIDGVLESRETLQFEAASKFLEKMTDVLSGTYLKKASQRIVKLVKVSRRVLEIKRLSQSFAAEEKSQLLYLESLFFSKSTPPRTLWHKRLIDLSAVHLSPVCNLIFSMRDVFKAGMEDRLLCVNWVLQQTELRALYFLKKLVTTDYDRMENALVVSDRLIEKVSAIVATELPSDRDIATLAVCFHLLSLCCKNSQLIVGQVAKVLLPTGLEKLIKHPLVLSGYFELVLGVIQKEDTSMMRDYLSMAINEIQAILNSIITDKANSLLRVAQCYDHASNKDEPLVRRKKKNELARLEDGSLELCQWKMILTSDKVVSKGVVPTLMKVLTSLMEKKNLWRMLERVKPELRELVFCLNELQKREPNLSIDRLIKKCRLCLDLLEQKKSTTGFLSQFTAKFILGLNNKKPLKADLFPIELADGSLTLPQAEEYISSLYSLMHGRTSESMHIESLKGMFIKLENNIDFDEIFRMLKRVGVLEDLCEAAASSDTRLCQMALEILKTMLKKTSVQTRNEFKQFLEDTRMHGSLLGKYCELLASVSSQAASYGEKCQSAFDTDQDPNSVIVSESFYERLEIVVEFLRLIQVCCDLCNEPFQVFLNQWPYPGSESVVWSLARALSELRRSMSLFIKLRPETPEPTYVGTFDTETVHFSFSLGEEVCKLIVALLEGLQELVTGPCKENQALLSRNSHMLLAVNQLMRAAINQNADIYAKTVELLLGLIEGEPEDVVIDRVCEVLNLRLFSEQIKSKFAGKREDEELSDTFTRLFIFLMKLKQRRSTHETLIQLASDPSYASFITKVGYVEVTKDDRIEGIYFPVPLRVKHMTRRSRQAVIWDIDRSTQMNQINEFMQKIKVWDYEMKHQMRINSQRYIKFFTQQWKAAGMISFFLVVLINACMLWDITSKEELLDGTHLPRRTLYTCMGIVQTMMGIIQYIFYYVEYYPNMIYEDEVSNKEILEGLVVEQPLRIQGSEVEEQKNTHRSNATYIKLLFWRFETLRFLGYIGCSLLAFYFPFCYGILLLDIVRKNSGLHTLLLSITINKERLLLTFCLGMLIVYIFSIFAFLFLKGDMDAIPGVECEDVLHCFTSIFGIGVKSQGEMLGAADPSSPMFWWRTLFDITFFILVIVILLNITFGVILNTFAQMRDEKNEKLLDIYSRCYICGHHRSEINLRGKGWRHHLVGEHSPFAYIAFFIYLADRPTDQCSGLEKYVKELYAIGNYSFMPTSAKQLQDVPQDRSYE